VSYTLCLCHRAGPRAAPGLPAVGRQARRRLREGPVGAPQRRWPVRQSERAAAGGASHPRLHQGAQAAGLDPHECGSSRTNKSMSALKSGLSSASLLYIATATSIHRSRHMIHRQMHILSWCRPAVTGMRSLRVKVSLSVMANCVRPLAVPDAPCPDRLCSASCKTQPQR